MIEIRNLRKVAGPEILPDGFTHLSGPNAIDLGAVIRIFFSSRMREVSGKSFSVPFFMDVDKSSLTPVGPASQIEIPQSVLGGYRENGIFPFTVHRLRGGGLMALATGWQRRTDVDVETGVGVFYSLDSGLTWVEEGSGPRWSARLYEPFLVCDANFLDAGRFKLLTYAFGVDWVPDESGTPQRRYLIGSTIAESFDTLENGNGQSRIPTLSEQEVQAYPSLQRMGSGDFLMTFCWRQRFGFRDKPEASYKLGFARSHDGLTWERLDYEYLDDLPEEASLMQCYPSLIEIEGIQSVIFNGNGFGVSGIFRAEVYGLE